VQKYAKTVLAGAFLLRNRANSCKFLHFDEQAAGEMPPEWCLEKAPREQHFAARICAQPS
jgi:hypothetical protein